MTWFDDDMDGIARSVELLQAMNTASTIAAPIMLLSALLLLGLLIHATIRRILHGPVEG